MPAAPPFEISPRNIVGATFITQDRQQLIQIQVEINGKIVTAIVDTGSMLNVVSRAAWRAYVSHVSMDITKHINMGDANGGQSQLRGYLKDVLLTMGGVGTRASFWVGDKVPFEVLLGRPWQRGNYVSIDERRDGTYLVFRDPDSGENRFELLVDESDDMQQNLSSNLAPYHTVPMPGAFMMQVIENRSPNIEHQHETVTRPSEELAALNREIFGDGESSSDSETGYQADHEFISCNGPESLHGHPTSDFDNHSCCILSPPLTPQPRSPICETCKVLLDNQLFEGVTNWDDQLLQFSQRANLIISITKGNQTNPSLDLQDITVHTHYTEFGSVETWETCDGTDTNPGLATEIILSLEKEPQKFAQLVSSPFLKTARQQRKVQGFLMMHPELVYHAGRQRITPSSFIKRICHLIRAHQTLFGADGTISGFSDSSLMYDVEAREPQDIRIVATNPNRFLSQFDGRYGTGPLITRFEHRLIKLELWQHRFRIPHAIFSLPTISQFVLPLLNFVQSNVRYTALRLGDLPDNSVHYPYPVPLSVYRFPIMESPRTSTPYFISAAVSDSHRYSLTTNVYDSDGNSVPSSPYDAGGNIRTGLLSTTARMNGTNTAETIALEPSRASPAPAEPVATTSNSDVRIIHAPSTICDFHRRYTPHSRPPALNPDCPFCVQRRVCPSPSAPPGARVPVSIIAMLELCQPSKSHSPTPPPSYVLSVRSIHWNQPIRESVKVYDAVLESLKMVFHHSRAFQRPSISDNLVLHQRELARRDDNRIKDEIEIYFNEERPAALPFEILMLFRFQRQWEKSNGHAGTTPPGFAIILNYLQRNVMPDALTLLHYAPGDQTVQDWEIVHRYGYEILSAQQNSSRVTRLLRSPEGTPSHLQAFPPGLNIRPGRNDPLTRHWAVLRNEILTSLRFIHLVCDNFIGIYPHLITYDIEMNKRKEFKAQHRLLPVFFQHQSNQFTPTYPADANNGVPLGHPFLHKFERVFLEETVDCLLRCAEPEAKFLADLIQQILPIQLVDQARASQMFLSGIFAKVGNLEFFQINESEDESEDESDNNDYGETHSETLERIVLDDADEYAAEYDPEYA
ncbi:hypothetical protein B0H11DRAFT_2369528 [Mycena galericulata]|nr:hypothetical protein B0H11DRAFT_2369528 [Mycena galericulata]